MKAAITRLITVFALTIFLQNAWAGHGEHKPTVNNWQMKALHQPGKFQLAREAKGYVNIYDGLTDSEVHKAMDAHFDRIENMMFTRVRVADAWPISNLVEKAARNFGDDSASEDCD